MSLLGILFTPFVIRTDPLSANPPQYINDVEIFSCLHTRTFRAFFRAHTQASPHNLFQIRALHV